MSSTSQLKSNLLLAILRAPTHNALACLQRVALPAPLRAFSTSSSQLLEEINDRSNDTTSIKITRSFTSSDQGGRQTQRPDRRPWQRNEASTRSQFSHSILKRDTSKHKHTTDERNKPSNPPKATEHAGRSSAARQWTKAPAGSKSTDAAPKREEWQVQKAALAKKFAQAPWTPRKRLSPDTLDGIRALHTQDASKYTTAVLAEHFAISPEAIRRILKSKWHVSAEKMDERRVRWARRHDRIWDAQAELGLRPQRATAREIEDPETFGVELERKRMLGHDI